MVSVFISKSFSRTRSCELIANRGIIYVQRKQFCGKPSGKQRLLRRMNFLVLLESFIFLNQGQQLEPGCYVRIFPLQKGYNLTFLFFFR